MELALSELVEVQVSYQNMLPVARLLSNRIIFHEWTRCSNFVECVVYGF